MPEHDTVAIVGVGLIGGSIGMALRERKLANEVIGIGRRASSLETAIEVGAIDRGTTSLAEGVQRAKFIVVCTPVGQIAPIVKQIVDLCPSDALITDAGSTKQALVEEIEAQISDSMEDPQFVGSHPLAGDHQTGPRHARADLLVGRTVLVTPIGTSERSVVRSMGQFWESLGANVVEMSPAEHDRAVAATSHLPHLVAAALASALPEEWGPLAASGWQDTTRVAAGDAAMWQQIFSTNRLPVLDALDQFEDKLASLRSAIAHGDDPQLQQQLEEAKRIRDALGN